MRLIRSDAFDYFKGRGVPMNVLTANFPENIKKHISYIEVPKSEGTALFDVKKQLGALAQFEKTISQKTSNKPFLLIGGRAYDFIPLQFALQVAANLVQNHGKDFTWHPVYGNTYDELRDNLEKEKDIKKVSLLIISNIAANSTAMKIEKVRDLLTKYAYIPRIVCVGGMDPSHKIDPVSWSKQSLNVKADYYLYC